MKTTPRKLFTLALAVATLTITSCSDDDNNDNNNVACEFVINATDLQGDINCGEVTLQANTVYKLTGKLQVNDGASLIIPAGTRIEAVGGTASYIAVAQGGKIYVNGTANNPVVMTSGLATKAPGDWGGLVVCGKAPINRVSGGESTAQAEVSDLTYGGTITNDNSGVIRYLRVEYAGAAYNSEKEFNALSFFGVGNGTVVEFVEAYHGSDDGFEWFGGTVNSKGLVAIGNEDDQFDWTEGWSGVNSDWYGKVDFGKGNRGIEADNYEFGFGNTPIAQPVINGLTLVGPGSAADGTIFSENDAMKLRRGTFGNISNVVVANWKTGLNIEHDETINAIGSGLTITNIAFTQDVPSKAKGKATNGDAVEVNNSFTESSAATGAGNGENQPAWAQGWSIGF